MSAVATASWYHCSVEPMSRSDGRSAVAAAAYRFGMSLHDERYAITHDYSRKRGVECAFMVAPVDAPDWAHDPERLWNEAERAERRINSRVAREAELALPSFLSADARQAIVQEFSEELVERYGVAVSAALHAPSRSGDQRNYHAHIMFTTREVTPEGMGKKTRVLDDKKTGPQEITKLRELTADIINEHLAAVNSDIRVDHRSFKTRGIEQAPTTHLGPAATEMERRGEGSDRGDINRQAEVVNSLIEERNAIDAEIAREEERLSNPPMTVEEERERLREASGLMEAQAGPEPVASLPPTTPEEERERIRAASRLAEAPTAPEAIAFLPPATVEEERERIRANAKPFTEAIKKHGELPERDGMSWWQRAALEISTKARGFAQAIASKVKGLWQERFGKDRAERQNQNERGPDIDRDADKRGFDR